MDIIINDIENGSLNSDLPTEINQDIQPEDVNDCKQEPVLFILNESISTSEENTSDRLDDSNLSSNKSIADVANDELLIIEASSHKIDDNLHETK